MHPASGQCRNTNQPHRSFAGFLLERAPDVSELSQVTRRHIEDYKPWLAARPGQNKPRASTATLAHRLGTLRMFFVRIDEWGWDKPPPRCRCSPATSPVRTTRCPRPWTTPPPRTPRAAHNDKRLLVRVTVEVLLRTGLRVGEFTALRRDAVVVIGAAPWLHVPVGKLREDRYLPLHPQLVELIDQYRRQYVPPEHPLLLPRENGRPADRHSVTRILNKPPPQPACRTSTPPAAPHPCHPGDQPGMSLEAIAAMLGHRSLDMTLRYAKIANRTVAEEYFAVTEKVDALYEQAAHCPPTPSDRT